MHKGSRSQNTVLDCEAGSAVAPLNHTLLSLLTMLCTHGKHNLCDRPVPYVINSESS